MDSAALSWTQAIAAAVQAVGAVVIYIVTRDSVRISKEMSRITADQLQLARIDRLADQKQRASALRGLAQSLESRVNALPERPQDTAFRQLPLWTDGEIEALHTTSAPVLVMAADAAGVAAVELLWIRDLLLAIRQVPPLQGFDYARNFNEMDWRERRATALLKLRELIQYANIVADQAEEQAKLLPRPSDARQG